MLGERFQVWKVGIDSVDGSVKNDGHLATGGGVLRDDQGNWIRVFLII